MSVPRAGASSAGVGSRPSLPVQLCLHPLAALQSVVHMRGQANGARMILDRADQGLSNPPNGVGGELEAACVIELLDRADQAQVALLNQVREGEAEVPVVLGNRDHELQVVLDEAILDSSQPILGCFDGVPSLGEAHLVETDLGFELLQPSRALASATERATGEAHLFAKLCQQRQRELRVVHLLGDSLVGTLDQVLGRAGRVTFTSPHGSAHALHRTFHACRDLTGVFIAGRLRQLRAGVRHRAQRIPTSDHVAGGTG